MKLQFKYQKFQADSAEAICRVFLGQEYNTQKYIIDKGIAPADSNDMFEDLDVFGFNNAPIILPERRLLENINKVQMENFIQPSKELEKISKTHIPLNLTVEMETGVGKTYTYIKTIFELNKRYGWTKFIVIVPSIAIREGVAKTFDITQDHFAEEYNKKINFFIYNSDHPTDIETFASSSEINVMIINSQAFASQKEARKIDKKLDQFRSRRPIDIIAKTNPILIIDEPQSVLGPVASASLDKFNPLMTIGYSATHRDPFNMVYRLDALEAYNKKLVKKIAVTGISESNVTGTEAYFYLKDITTYKDKNPTASLEFDVKTKSGSITSKTFKVDVGYNIFEHTNGLQAYKGFVVSNINANTGELSFTNNVSIKLGEVINNMNENQVRRVQIRETILAHIKKEEQLFDQHIKVLSLFFIDEVSKYKDYEREDTKGLYARIFEEEYANIVEDYVGNLDTSNEYKKWLKKTLDSIPSAHTGYFSEDKNHHFINGKIDKEGSSTDIDAYDLIMKNKERLLDRHEPVRFIFSHSALKEGWDNPNVFQICTLKPSDPTKSTIRKRQEVGRGMRLCVNDNGVRMDSAALGDKDVHNVNLLTVIANESYADFAGALQKELAESIVDRPREVSLSLFQDKLIKDNDGNEVVIDDELASDIYSNLKNIGYIKDKKVTDKYIQDRNNDQLAFPESISQYSDGIKNILASIYTNEIEIIDTHENVDIKLNDQFYKKEFKDLWNKINVKSIYSVNFDSDELIKKSIEKLNSDLQVRPIEIEVTTASMSKIDSKEKAIAGSLFGRQQIKRITINSSDIKQQYDLVGEIVKQTGLTRNTIIKILKGIEECVFNQFKVNPEEFISKVSNQINEQKATLLIEHITYEATTDTYDDNIFTEANLKGNIKSTMETVKNVFDRLLSDSQVERDFATELEKAEDVVVYAKLPSGFYIKTPVGNYNPDWAVVFKEGSVKHIYFIAETKGSMETLQLTPIARAKKHCAIEHFKAISNGVVKYDIVSDYKALLTKVMAG